MPKKQKYIPFMDLLQEEFTIPIECIANIPEDDKVHEELMKQINDRTIQLRDPEEYKKVQAKRNREL